MKAEEIDSFAQENFEAGAYVNSIISSYKVDQSVQKIEALKIEPFTEIISKKLSQLDVQKEKTKEEIKQLQTLQKIKAEAEEREKKRSLKEFEEIKGLSYSLDQKFEKISNSTNETFKALVSCNSEHQQYMLSTELMDYIAKFNEKNFEVPPIFKPQDPEFIKGAYYLFLMHLITANMSCPEFKVGIDNIESLFLETKKKILEKCKESF